MPDPDPVVLKPGARLRSAVCTTEGMVIQAPAAPVVLTCGAAPLAPLGAPVPAPTSGAPLAIKAARPLPSSD